MVNSNTWFMAAFRPGDAALLCDKPQQRASQLWDLATHKNKLKNKAMKENENVYMSLSSSGLNGCHRSCDKVVLQSRAARIQCDWRAKQNKMADGMGPKLRF